MICICSCPWKFSLSPSILTKDLIMVISSKHHRFTAINEMNTFDQSEQVNHSYL